MKVLKYYAFDFDDNILHMPTQIKMLNNSDDFVLFSTKRYAEIRGKLDELGYKVVEDSFVNFSKEKDDLFLREIFPSNHGHLWKTGPSFSDFVECINNASLFSIITFRGHSKETMISAIKFIIDIKELGFNKAKLVKNQKKFMKLSGESCKNFTESDFINYYINQCRFYMFGNKDTRNHLDVDNTKDYDNMFKALALKDFIEYIEVITKNFIKKTETDVFVRLGFSDDDVRNIEVVRKFLEDEQKSHENIFFHIYDTSSGEKV